MIQEKKQTLSMTYVSMCKTPGQSLTHYACTGGRRGYLTLRLRQTEAARKPWKDMVDAGTGYTPAMT